MRPQPRYKKGDKIGGRYLVADVKMGGMGEVYLCLDLETNLPYALKTFQHHYLTNLKLRQVFENEVAIWAALEKHPNIVRCYYMDFIDNQPFMILEWIAGEEGRGNDLRSWLRRGSLDLRLALDFTIDICRGLIHAQQKQPGIVHRDLKPENILIALGRLAKITDFGLAKIVQAAELEISSDMGVETGMRQSLLGQGGTVGTPPYMAPEQWRNETLDARTDIYAVGCILYEMLTGSQPFRATTLDSLRRQHLAATIPKLMDHQTLPTSLDALLIRCLAKQREERFTTMDRLLEELSLIYQQQFTEEPSMVTISDEFVAVDYVHRGLTYENLRLYNKSLADYNRAIELDPTLALAYTNRGVAYERLEYYEEALADHHRAIQLDPTYALAYSNRGVTYQLLQRYRKALADHNCAIELDPADAIAYYNRAVTYVGLQHYEEALADYNRAIQLDPTYTRAYIGRGSTYTELGRYEEALADYSHTIQLDPTYTSAYLAMGYLLYKTKKWQDALPYLEKVAELGDPQGKQRAMQVKQVLQASDAFKAFAYASSLDEMRQVVAQFPFMTNPEYIAGVEKTIAQSENKSIYEQPLVWLRHIENEQSNFAYANPPHVEKVLVNYTRAIRLNPTDPIAYLNRGNAYYTLQRYDEALKDYSIAIGLDPNYTSAYSNRAVLYVHLQRYNEALADYSQTIQLDPANTTAYNNRGNIYTRLERYDEALADYNRAIQLDPTNAKAYFDIGRLLEKQGALQKAVTYYENARQLGLSETDVLVDHNNTIQLNPKNPQVYIDRGSNNARLQKYEEALTNFTQAIELDPTNKEAYYNRGLTYAVLQYYDKALVDYTHAIEFDPTYSQAYINRGSLYYLLDRPDKALTDFNQAIQLDPTNAQPHFNIGVVLANQAKWHEALSYFERAAQFGDPNAAQIAALVRQELSQESMPQVNSTQLAFEGFQKVSSIDEMRLAVANFPFMVEPDFIAAIEQVISEQIPLEHRLAFEQRLAWLRQIADKPKTEEQNQ